MVFIYSWPRKEKITITVNFNVVFETHKQYNFKETRDFAITRKTQINRLKDKVHNPTTTADIAKHNGANMNGEQEPVATGILATAKLATADTALVLEWGTADPSNN